MLKVPHEPFPAVSMSWMLPPTPGATAPAMIAAMATGATSEWTENMSDPLGLSQVRGIAGDAIQHDTEQHDAEACGQTLASQRELRETGYDVVAERPCPDQAADDHHGQHVQQSLVG